MQRRLITTFQKSPTKRSVNVYLEVFFVASFDEANM